MAFYEASALERVAVTVMEGAGASPDAAAFVSRSLVLSNRVAHHSHGISLLPFYVDLIRERSIAPGASWEVVGETNSTALIDGKWEFGQILAVAATCVIGKARDSGLGGVGVYNVSLVGRLGEYSEMVAAEGLLGIVLMGGGAPKDGGVAAPFGGAKSVWGTNPLAVAVPSPDFSFSLDFATTAIACAKVGIARKTGDLLPERVAINDAGQLTQDPWEVHPGDGSLLPFGEHKGYAIAFLIEMLAGAWIGTASSDTVEGDTSTGLFLIAIDPERFRPRSGMETSFQHLFDYVRSCPPAEGFDEVLVPGEIEDRAKKDSYIKGIDIPGEICEDLDKFSANLGVSLDWAFD